MMLFQRPIKGGSKAWRGRQGLPRYFEVLKSSAQCSGIHIIRKSLKTQGQNILNTIGSHKKIAASNGAQDALT
jgi:hypothetical protein